MSYGDNNEILVGNHALNYPDLSRVLYGLYPLVRIQEAKSDARLFFDNWYLTECSLVIDDVIFVKKLCVSIENEGLTKIILSLLIFDLLDFGRNNVQSDTLFSGLIL